MNPFGRFLRFVSSASRTRTFGILAFLILAAAVPLTVFVSQQRQEIRQRASGQMCSPGEQKIDCLIDIYTCAFCPGGGGMASTSVCSSDGQIWSDPWGTDTCVSSCGCSTSVGKGGSCINNNDCTSTGNPCIVASCITGICDTSQLPGGTSCGTNLVCDDVGNCIGNHLYCANASDCVQPSSQCQFATCITNACQISNYNNGTPCNNGTCDGQGNCGSSAPTPTPPPTGCSGNPCAAGKTWVPIGTSSGFCCGYGNTNNVCGSGTSSCVGLAYSCQNNTWQYADASGSSGECTPSCGGNSCGGGIGGGATPTPTPTVPAGPTPTPVTNGAPACDSSQINMTYSPNPAISGSTITFSDSGSQGSTWIGDSWSGGVDCSGAFWGSKTCNATAQGTFQWTHTWKNCAPNNCNITSAQCSQTINYSINPLGCNQITMTASPNPANVNQQVNFSITGDASTYINDTFSGGGIINCSGAWNNQNCTATQPGSSLTWTHSWKQCIGDIYHCPTSCSQTQQFSVLPSPSPSPTPTATPTPTGIPTPTGVQCNGVQNAGGEGIDTKEWEMAQTQGWFYLSYDMYVLPDQIDVYYENRLIYTSGGLVSGPQQNIPIRFGPGTSTKVKVVITASIGGTSWEYSLSCPQINPFPSPTSAILTPTPTLSPTPTPPASTVTPTQIATPTIPIVQCSNIQNSGSEGLDTKEWEMAQTQGWFYLTYDMFTIPDQIDIYYENNLIYTSGGPVSNAMQNIPIRFGPGTSTKVKVVITANSAGTSWDYSLSCPQPGPFPTVTPSPTIFVSPTPIGFCANNNDCPNGQMCSNSYCIAIPSATPTLIPNGTRLALNLILSGIGFGNGSNPNPVHTQKDATVCLYDPQVDPSGDSNCDRAAVKKSGPISFNSSSGSFVNSQFDLGIINSGQYQVLIRTNKYLRKRVPQIVTIASGQVNQVPQVTFIVGDINNDNILNILDYNIYMSCFGSKSGTSTCIDKDGSDLNDDGKNDDPSSLPDYRLLFSSFQTQAGD